MIVAIGGDDPGLPHWAAAAEAAGGQVIPIVGVEGSPLAGTLHSPSPDADGTHHSVPEAAILAGRAATLLAAARAVGPQTPLLVIPSASDAPTIAYALLPQVDDGRRVVPGWSHRASPAVTEYLTRFVRGDLGDLSLLRMDRTVAPGNAPHPDLIARDEIDARFFIDVDLLRLIGGDYRQITALEIGAHPEGARQMTVTLGAPAAAEAVWTITRGVTDAWKLTVTGTRGTAELAGNGEGAIALTVNGSQIPLSGERSRETLLRQFFGAVDASEKPLFLDPARAAWTDYVRAADLLQALHRSLRRRRTIDLQFESASERSQFKTQMTAVGCGVLTWALLGTCAGLLFGSLLDPRDGTERRAAAAGTILWRADFTDDGQQPTESSLRRLYDRVAVDGAEAIVLIERAADPNSSAMDSERLQAVTAALKSQAGGTLLPQVEVRPLAGGWFHWAMLAIWIVTFAPLAVFLILQCLIVLAREPANGKSAAG